MTSQKKDRAENSKTEEKDAESTKGPTNDYAQGLCFVPLLQKCSKNLPKIKKKTKKVI